MKVLRSSIFRAVCAIAVGVLLVKYPDSTVTWLTVAIGVLFLLSGVLSCLTYIGATRQSKNVIITDADGRTVYSERPAPPIVGIGSVVLGFMLAITPGTFVSGLMYVLGAILILGAVNQLMALLAARRICRVPLALWVCPSIVLLTGILVITKPLASASLSLVILGWCSLLYGVTEAINSLKLYALRKRFEKTNSDAIAKIEK